MLVGQVLVSGEQTSFGCDVCDSIDNSVKASLV